MEKVKNANECFSSRLNHSMLWLCLVSLTFGVSNTLSAENLSSGIAFVSEEKERVEAAADFLIRNNKKASAKYRVGKVCYNEARAAFKGWIDAIIFDLKSGKGVEEIDLKINMLTSAIEKSEMFYNYVFPKRTTWSASGIGTVVTILGIVTEVVKWLIDEWDNKNEELIKQLEELKIKPFSVLENEIK